MAKEEEERANMALEEARDRLFVGTAKSAGAARVGATSGDNGILGKRGRS